MADRNRVPTEPDRTDVLARMERDWDARAREAPEYYIATGHKQWQMDEFFQSGEINVDNDIVKDADFTCSGKELSRLRILEIGCGAGRMTRALAALFGEVYAVDISAEMITAAKRNLADLRNVVLYKNNGADLSDIPDRSCDFAFSFIVFQHIPAADVIESYVREVHRCLKPGAVFKFQVQGNAGLGAEGHDTWVGVSLSLNDARGLAERCGFELLCGLGEGTQYFWLYFLKPKWTWLPAWLRRRAGEAFARAQKAIEKSVEVSFSPPTVQAGGSYVVHIPTFGRQTIDIGYALASERDPAPITGVVTRWCELDSQGEALIRVPAEHPAGTVQITKLRSRTKRSQWHRAKGAIQVVNPPAKSSI